MKRREQKVTKYFVSITFGLEVACSCREKSTSFANTFWPFLLELFFFKCLLLSTIATAGACWVVESRTAADESTLAVELIDPTSSVDVGDKCEINL